MQLTVRGLSKVYGPDKGLFPVSFDVRAGELVAIVGHNGAGKSTLLKMLSNWIQPDSGEILVNGLNLKNRQTVVKTIGFVPEVPNLFDFFSVGYNLKFFARLFGSPLSRVDEILREFNLISFKKTKVRTLSKGLRQRVNIGRSLIANPPFLLFDEPTSGLDVDMTSEVYRMMLQMNKAGKTILFTTHRPEEIKDLATRILVFNKGVLIFDGTPADYFQTSFYKNSSPRL
ncbi:MAG: ABC transporter ATP-binding protein [Pseudomonadota bacterium]|nr:ABC transporter ATP-binding protein [Pseudomonadota bacterium]